MTESESEGGCALKGENKHVLMVFVLPFEGIMFDPAPCIQLHRF